MLKYINKKHLKLQPFNNQYIENLCIGLLVIDLSYIPNTTINIATVTFRRCILYKVSMIFSNRLNVAKKKVEVPSWLPCISCNRMVDRRMSVGVYNSTGYVCPVTGEHLPYQMGDNQITLLPNEYSFTWDFRSS